jgi:hypothetical protein
MFHNEKIIDDFKRLTCEMSECPSYEYCRSICPHQSQMDTVNPPFPDFVGRKYSGLVIVGANPGTSFEQRFKNQDLHFKNLLDKLKRSKRTSDYHSLLDYRNIASQEWHKTLCSNFFRSKLEYDFETVAFVNIVKCRTLKCSSNVENNVGRSVVSICTNRYLKKQLNILNPNYIVCQWKPVKETLRSIGYNFQGVSMVGCFSGQRNIPDKDKIMEIIPIFEIFTSEITHGL